MPRSFGVTIDCADPLALAAFWRDVLDYVDDPPPTGYPSWAAYDDEHGIDADEASAGATILDPTGQGARLYFQRVPEAKVAKNRVHLDIVAGDGRGWDGVLAAIERAVAAGATRVAESGDPGDPFVIMRDPEGNEFCLVPGT
jgi:catechol 2,3-dioxygenase-like lactoylglutathione lyase family enzyme